MRASTGLLALALLLSGCGGTTSAASAEAQQIDVEYVGGPMTPGA